jgi:undecaprenyl-diphosphatase
VFGPVLLGLVQGLAEFLPVSSSGHLVLAERLLGLARPGLSLEVALHAGTLASVLAVYGRDLTDRRLWGAILWATLPAALAGSALQAQVNGLFGSLRAVGAGWAVSAALLWWASRRRPGRRGAASLRPREALLLGCFQALALAPGVSRSGAVLAAGLGLGLEPVEAARFAFLLSIPTVAGAALLALPQAHLSGAGVTGLWLGAGSAAVAGVAAMRWFVGRLGRGRMGGFAAYCAALAAVAMASGA